MNNFQSAADRAAAERAAELGFFPVDIDCHPESWELMDMRIVRAAVQNPETTQPDALTELLQTIAEDFEPQGFKVGDRVEFADQKRHKGEVFTVTRDSIANGMTSMKDDKGVSFSVHYSELSLLSGKLEIAPSAHTHELQPDRLTTLASDIRAAYTDCEQALTVVRSAESSALEHAKRCGELLLEAKKANGHGGWEAWRNENTGIPSSTASPYQRIAERWDEVKGLKIASLKAIDAHFRAAKKQLKANPQTSVELPATPPLPPIGTKLEGKDGAIAEVVKHDGALAVVNSRDGSTVTSSRLTAGEVERIYQAAAEKGDRSEDPPEPEQPKPKARVKVGAGHLRAIAKDQSASAFKLLSSLKENLSEEIDLLGVADALEEAIMQVLEEWILGEDS